MSQSIQTQGKMITSKKFKAGTVELWKKHQNRDVLYAFKLKPKKMKSQEKKESAKRNSDRLVSDRSIQSSDRTTDQIDIEYKVFMKNMDIFFGKDSGIIHLSSQNPFVFFVRFCANSKTSFQKILWEEHGKKEKKSKKKK